MDLSHQTLVVAAPGGKHHVYGSVWSGDILLLKHLLDSRSLKTRALIEAPPPPTRPTPVADFARSAPQPSPAPCDEVLRGSVLRSDAR